jgi:dTDP-4-dehydrorhamnose reductase
MAFKPGEPVMKILISGCDGQLGSDCGQVLRKNHEVVGVDLKDMDITDAAIVKEVIYRVTPDIVVNCAAYTNVDACEKDRSLAWRVNVEGPKNLASMVETYGGRLIHISTDYVFDGWKNPPEPYLEDDEPNPLSNYGRTKLEGERAVIQATDRHVILRTAWLYGVRGQNFLKTMLVLALKKPEEKIRVVNDQFGSPSWSYRLALQIEKLIQVKGHGVYHATSEGHCTWYELAKGFLETIGVPHALIPCATKDYPTPAPRPRNSILENRRLKEQGINVMPHWQKDLDQFVSMFGERLIREARGVV